MSSDLDLQPGAVGFTMTTTPCLDIVTLIASLNVRGDLIDALQYCLLGTGV